MSGWDGKPGQTEAAGGGGGEGGPLHAGPWEEWLWWRGEPAREALLCSRQLEKIVNKTKKYVKQRNYVFFALGQYSLSSYFLDR